ncbi:camp-dependent protein kinase regulatory subunit, partial [Dichotomocladium elegans]
KTPDQKKRIYKATENNFLFRNLDDDLSARLVAAMAEKHVSKDTTVIEQGARGDYYFIVESGTFDCFIDKNLVTQYGPGGSFGELALLYNAPRAATIVSTADAVLWALNRITFRSILMTSTLEKRKLYESILSQVPLLQSLGSFERHKIADALERIAFEDASIVMQEGEVGRNFYIVEDGEAVILKKMTDGTIREVGRCHKGKSDYFGELALLHDKARAATVKAVGQLRCVTLSKDDFNRLLGPLKDIIQRNSENY